MGILRKITDEYFGDSMRSEDYVKFNTGEMVGVDMGGSVLWADRDLEIVDGGTWCEYKKYFNGDEMLKMRFKNGWRIPTFNEFLELFDKENGVTRHIKRDHLNYWHIDGASFIHSDIDGDGETITYNELLFEDGGRYDKNEPGYIICRGSAMYRWTQDIDKSYNGIKYIYVFDIIETEDTIGDWWGDDGSRLMMDNEKKFIPIRLVKDKK